MIETLTPEQDAMLARVRDEWVGYGLSTEPADKPAAEAGVRLAYEAAGLKPPPIILWADSPLSGAYMRSLVADPSVRGQVQGQVRAQVRAQVGDQIGAQVWAQVWGQVWDQVQDQVWPQVRAQVQDQVRVGLIDDWIYGWGAWAAAHESLGVTGLDIAHGIQQVARTSGRWWWAYQGVAILTHRPTSLHLDKEGRLHCEDGPATAYRDGFSVYAWHGTRVPADLIEGGWDVERIFAEPNAEIRRCAIERMGWPQFIAASGMTQVGQAQPDPGNPGQTVTLYDLPEELREDPIRVLLCDNATRERDGVRHRFGLTVPDDINGPVHAAAWSFGVDVETYRALERAS